MPKVSSKNGDHIMAKNGLRKSRRVREKGEKTRSKVETTYLLQFMSNKSISSDFLLINILHLRLVGKCAKRQ